MNELLNQALAPKSDQLNADDLLGGARTIKITGVKIGTGEQPISIFYEGDNGKPYKPCKSMGRLLRELYGSDGNKWVGNLITVYRDPDVTWAGIKVGGIRISHASGLNGEKSMPLTASKTVKKVYTVKPLQNAPAQAPAQQPANTEDPYMDLLNQISRAWDTDSINAAKQSVIDNSASLTEEQKADLNAKYKERVEKIREQA